MCRKFLCAVVAGSPYLANLMTRQPMWLQDALCARTDPMSVCPHYARGASGNGLMLRRRPKMRCGRCACSKANVRPADGSCRLAGVWPVMQVTDALSRAADAAVQGAVRFLVSPSH